jgi:putative acetyltransferase
MMQLQEGVSAVRADDLPRVLEVWEASVRATHHFVTEMDIQFIKALLQDALPTAPMLCVRDGEGIVTGFMIVTDGKIEALFVDDSWRGQGIGSRLVRHAVDKLDATMLDVNEQNEQALGFYLRLGFEVVGRSELDGLGKPYPLLHMRLVAKK